MMGPTHLLLGLTAAIPAAAVAGQPVVLALGLLGGLWPDLDLSETTLSRWGFQVAGGRGRPRVVVRPFAPLAQFAGLFTRHRSVWHSLPAALIFSLLPGLLVGWAGGAAFLLGYLSHLLADACTPAGISWWPRSAKWHLLPPGHRLPTGSPLEHLVSAVAALALVAYLAGQLF